MSMRAATRREYRGFGYYETTGVGAIADKLACILRQEYPSATLTPVLLRPRIEALEELKRVYLECHEANWDGEGAEPITEAAYDEASRFLKLLPFMFQVPEIVPAPNGQIGLEWYLERNRLFVLTLGGNQILTYAGLYGTPEAIPGTAHFKDTIPEEVLLRLNRLYSGE